MKKKLQLLRKKIDTIDAELLQLLAKRMCAVSKVGALKKAHGVLPFDEQRWKEVLESKLSLARELNLSEEFIRGVYNYIHEHALTLETDAVAIEKVSD